MAISWQSTAVMVVASALVICTLGSVEGTTTDASSCAAILCLSPSVCENGQCKLICPSGTANCNGDFADGCEVNFMDGDVANCGGCKRGCNPKSYEFASCESGQCKYIDRCAAIKCRAYPNAETTCSKAQCRVQCLPGFDNCDGDLETNGCEVNLRDDVNNCGKCQHKCPNSRPYGAGVAKCSGGVCY